MKKLKFFPSIDLFASRFNIQLSEFISYRPEPESKAMNAFTQLWTDRKFYVFPPFICLSRVIQKILQDGANGLLVAPDWPNQLWYDQFCNMITKDFLLPPRQDLLLSPTDPNITKNYTQIKKGARLTFVILGIQIQTNYNSHIRKSLKYCTKEGISDPYMASYDQKI